MTEEGNLGKGRRPTTLVIKFRLVGRAGTAKIEFGANSPPVQRVDQLGGAGSGYDGKQRVEFHC